MTGILGAARTAVVVVAVVVAPMVARAADTVVAPGGQLTLSADLVLSGADALAAGDAGSAARCKIHGNGFSIYSDDTWTGSLSIRNCDLDGLGFDGMPSGSMDKDAISADGGTAFTITGSTFSQCSAIAVAVSGDGSVLFKDNTIKADSIVRAPLFEPDSQPAFYGSGFSTGSKMIQGNRILKSYIHLQATSDWLVGGSGAAEGNVLVGLRAGIHLEAASGITVRGNYSRTQIGADGWNQVKNFTLNIGDANLVEHNVFRGFNWLTEINAGVELRYNLLLEAVERGWVYVRSTSGALIHHNVLVAVKDGLYQPAGAFVLVTSPDPTAPQNVEIFNNTLDAGGVCAPGIGGAVVLPETLASLRSNALTGVRMRHSAGTALVRPDSTEVIDPPPVLLGYTDYNLFYDMDPSVTANYAVAVAGKAERQDPGFGYHDIPVGGALDAQENPKFAGPLPHLFPYSDADLIAGTATVCQVLAYYRKTYQPGAGSPLIDAGDPADGPGNDIGAIGAGVANAQDNFGRLCDPNDIGQPAGGDDVYTCPTVPLDPGGGGSGTGGSGVIPGDPPRGFTCVCDAAGAPGRTGTASLTALAAIALALALRRRRPARARAVDNSLRAEDDRGRRAFPLAE
jgi:MYXO-CTERM domain-containing protein